MRDIHRFGYITGLVDELFLAGHVIVRGATGNDDRYRYLVWVGCRAAVTTCNSTASVTTPVLRTRQTGRRSRLRMSRKFTGIAMDPSMLAASNDARFGGRLRHQDHHPVSEHDDVRHTHQHLIATAPQINLCNRGARKPKRRRLW
uniref:Uncharacterized protein MLCL622.25 n=1 Tax=Mycobacterium leprae TaxID=1769 RepID=O06088_MYCLR|nr:unknown [Mycobacterium leprae]